MEEKNNQKIILYQNGGGEMEIKVYLRNEMVWLTQAQIAILFGTKRPAITKHLGHIFGCGELREKSVSSILEHTAADGKKYKTKFFNLDAIISVGYRLNSKRATKFRIWATRILHDHILKGYTVNQKRLEENRNIKLTELGQAIKLLRRVADAQQIKSGEAKGLLKVITEYADSWVLLQKYDKRQLRPLSSRAKHRLFSYDEAMESINLLKKDLLQKKEAAEIFGHERDSALRAILGNIGQSFGGKELYPSLEEKAAHLLYFSIKDHPFTDGNKRIASFLFIVFLQKNNYLLDKGGTKKINDNALVALALLVAESRPTEKDTMVALITNLLHE